MEAFLQSEVHDSLHAFMYKNAVFLAERLNASHPSEARWSG